MNRTLSRIGLAAVLLIASAARTQGQDCLFFTEVAGAAYDPARVAQLTGQIRATPQLLRRVSDALTCGRPRSTEDYEARLAPVTLRGAFNSEFPLDRNNGSLWAGRGASASLTGGALFAWGPLTLGVAPTVAFQQNSSFPTVPVDRPGYSDFIYPNQPEIIDWPQRFGENGYTNVDLGQSFLRVDVNVISAGLSNENLWLGTATRYPLLLSNTAGGFPHVFVGAPPLATPIGQVSAQAFWGRLDESDYFDDDDNNNGRLLSGIVLGYEPLWTPGLVLGLARLYTSNIEGRGVAELLARPYGLSGSATRGIEDNSIFALYGRYVLPSAGLEVYAEWGHEVGYRSLGDLLREPDQSQAYVLGLDKITSLGSYQLRVYGELTHLDAPLPIRSGRGVISFYTHGSVRQGHTQRGQLLGAWIGPGSNAQIIGVDVMRGANSVGLFVERTRFDADAYYSLWSLYYGHNGHDAELAVGLRNVTRIGALHLSVETSYGKRYNRMFRLEDGSQPGRFTDENNANLEIGLHWFPAVRF